MSLRCMVGNYARCNENNKAGSIAVSKNTANAECLLGAFVCHLRVFAWRLTGRWEPRSALSHPLGAVAPLHPSMSLRTLCLGSSASRAGAGVGMGGEVVPIWGCVGASSVTSPAHSLARQGEAVGW